MYQYPTLDQASYNYPILDSAEVQKNFQKEEEKAEENKEIIHQVNPCDTIYGISLQYDVSIQKIKAYNNLHSDDIYYLKEIRIPNPQTQLFPPYNDEDVMQTTRRQYLLYFATLVKPEDSKDEKMLKYYLSDAQWDVKIALEEYQKDLKYEEEQKKLNKSWNPFRYQKLEMKKMK